LARSHPCVSGNFYNNRQTSTGSEIYFQTIILLSATSIQIYEKTILIYCEGEGAEFGRKSHGMGGNL
jgi:hypothetical protein